MEREVVGSRESSFTEHALEGSVAGMFAVVSGQFVGPCKLPRALRPRTPVGFLSRVSAQVGFQV